MAAPVAVSEEDSKRLALGDLVKKGRLSAEEAVAYAEKMGLMSTGDKAALARATSFTKMKQSYNFSVYKWSKARTVQRLILQFDFQSQTLSSIQHGTRTKKVEFNDISNFQSEDGLRLTIQFASQNEYELDADTQDEKNKMIRLLDAIVRHQRQLGMASVEESQQVYKEQLHEVHAVMSGKEDDWREMSQGLPPKDPAPLEKDWASASTPVHVAQGVSRETHIAPPPLPSTEPIMEGMVEKKGHAAAFLMWPKRWLRVCDGELLYFKPDDLENALNIIPLNPSVTEVKKVDSSVFTVTLIGSRKLFCFRPIADPSKKIEEERNAWYKAICDGCYRRRQSDARLRKGTLTAKQAYLEHEKSKRATLEKDQDPFASDDISPKVKRRRSTMIDLTKKLKLRKSIHGGGGVKGVSAQEPVVSPRSRSPGSFVSYQKGFDVTTPYTTPGDLKNLEITGKNAADLLDMLNTEMESLSDIVTHTSTGSSKVDMIVARLSTLISALREKHRIAGITSRDQTPASDENTLSSETGAPPTNLRDSDAAHPPPSSCHAHSDTDPQGSVEDALSLFPPRLPRTLPPPTPRAPWRARCPLTSGPLSPQTRCLWPAGGMRKGVTRLSPLNTPPQSCLPLLPHPLPFLGFLPPPPIGGGGAPPPPPPPFMMQMPALPPRASRKPNKRMKKIHWVTVQTSLVPSSGWMEWAKEDFTDSLNLSQLEELFGADEKDSKAPAIAKKVATTSLLDPSRGRNIEIFLPSLPISLGELNVTLNDLLNIIDDTCPLAIEHIVALKRFQPSEEDKEMFKKYRGDKQLLQNADHFLMKLCDIPLLSPRLDLLYTIREFPSNFQGFQPIIELAWQACRELDTCKEFVQVLQYVLAIGNYLNAGSRQGGAYGFRMSALSKLIDVRAGQDKKVTLLHYLVEQLHQKQPELLELPVKMEAVSKASEISIMSIVAELEVMNKELDKIERSTARVAEHPKMSQSTITRLQKDVKEFVASYRICLSALNEKGQEAEETYQQLLLRFGEPPNTDSEDFFAAIANFLKQFKKVVGELYPPPPVAKPRARARKDSEPAALSSEDSRPSSKCDDVPAVLVESVDVGGKRGSVGAPLSPQPLETRPSDRAPARTPGPTLRKLMPKEGYLEKQSHDGKKWNKRYFELEHSQLHYYQDKAKGKGRYGDTIRLNRSIPITVDPDDPRAFVVKTEERMWVFRADTLQLANEWVTVLRTHAQAAR